MAASSPAMRCVQLLGDAAAVCSCRTGKLFSVLLHPWLHCSQPQSRAAPLNPLLYLLTLYFVLAAVTSVFFQGCLACVNWLERRLCIFWVNNLYKYSL